MIKFFSIFLGFIIVLSCAHPSVDSAGKPGGLRMTGTGDQQYAPGEVLVKFREGTDQEAIGSIQRAHHLKTIRMVSEPNLYLMQILDGSSVEEVTDRLRALPEVEHAEPNFKVKIHPHNPGTKAE